MKIACWPSVFPLMVVPLSDRMIVSNLSNALLVEHEMADQRGSSRSGIVIPFIVGGVLLLLAAISFFPLWSCPECGGAGVRIMQEISFAPTKRLDKEYPCRRCEGKGRLSLRQRLISKHEEEVLKGKVDFALTPGGREISEINYEGFSKTDAREAVGATEIRLDKPITEDIRKKAEDILLKTERYDSVEVRFSDDPRSPKKVRVTIRVKEKAP